MPQVKVMLYIGVVRGFRPCLVTYSPPAVGSNGDYQVTHIQDKFEYKDCVREYDIANCRKLNDMNTIIGKAIRIKQDGPDPAPTKKNKKPMKPQPVQQQLLTEEDGLPPW